VINKEKLERAALARRLRDSGVQIMVDDSWKDSVLRLRQIGLPSDSRAFDIGTGETVYIIKVFIQIVSISFSISSISLELPWRDDSIALLTDPLERAAGYCDYRFYGRRILEIERSQVLNHKLVCPGLFSRRAPFEGVLLWSGIEEIPNAFVQGGNVPATMIVYDQFDDSYPFQVSLRLDRRKKWIAGKQIKRTRGSLFPKRDLGPC
jgi:hypothetical protein